MGGVPKAVTARAPKGESDRSFALPLGDIGHDVDRECCKTERRKHDQCCQLSEGEIGKQLGEMRSCLSLGA